MTTRRCMNCLQVMGDGETHMDMESQWLCGAPAQRPSGETAPSSNDAFPTAELEALAVKFSDGEIPFAPQSNNDRIAAFLRSAIASHSALIDLCVSLRTKLREHGIDP